MLSTALCIPGWTDARRVRRAIVLPFVGAVVGLFLTTTYASPRTSRPRDVASTIESTPPILETTSPLLHSPATAFDAQRRFAPTTSDLQAAHGDAFVHERRATIALTARRSVARTTHVARGYDATAPPLRFV